MLSKIGAPESACEGAFPVVFLHGHLHRHPCEHSPEHPDFGEHPRKHSRELYWGFPVSGQSPRPGRSLFKDNLPPKKGLVIAWPPLQSLAVKKKKKKYIYIFFFIYLYIYIWGRLHLVGTFHPKISLFVRNGHEKKNGFSCFPVFYSFLFLPFFALVFLLSLCFLTS